MMIGPKTAPVTESQLTDSVGSAGAKTCIRETHDFGERGALAASESPAPMSSGLSASASRPDSEPERFFANGRPVVKSGSSVDQGGRPSQ